MPIILDNLTSEQFDELRKKIAGIDDMEERLAAMEPLTTYTYVDELLDETEWKTRLAAAEQARDDYRQKYIERFFSGTGLENEEIKDTLKIDEKEENDGSSALNPDTFEELYREE